MLSDHDERLRRQLGDQPWLRTFTAGDPASLTRVLDAAITDPPARPGTDAVERLGLATPDDTVRVCTELHRSLPGAGGAR